MNVKMLRQIEADLRKPKGIFKKFGFDMVNWVTPCVGPCTTALCIGGDALVQSGARVFYNEAADKYVFLKPGKTVRDYRKAQNDECDLGKVCFYDNEENAAAKILGLKNGQSRALFFVHWWPDEYRERYRNAQNDRDRRLAGADRIAHFIATNGAE